LKKAGNLAKGLGARIRLLAPHIVPYPVPLEERLVGTACLEQRFRTIVGSNTVDTRIDIRVCRNRWQMVQHALPDRSVVVLGGSNGWWTAGRRLSRKLEAAGHHVVFVADEK
jgi:hypothetical protein